MQGQNFADIKHSWGTHWELDGNKGKMKKILPTTPPKLERKNQGTLSAC
jgi:hypothetical protein